MTAELVLLFVVYATLIMGIFIPSPWGNGGIVGNFHNNLPTLSARVEKHVTTGWGFQKESGRAIGWTKAPN